MKLMNVTKRVNDLLVVTRLLTVFDCFETEADALASFEYRPLLAGADRKALCIGAAIVGGALMLAPVAAQQGPPINSGIGTMVLEGTLDQEYGGVDAIFVMTFAGARHAFHVAKDLLVHGGNGSGVDALKGLHAGETVAVHYSVTNGERSAVEIDRVGAGGLSTTEGTVIGINRRRKQIVIRFAEHRAEIFELTDRAAQNVGRDLDKAPDGPVRVTVYYTDQGGQKVAHFFKKVKS